MSEHPSPGAPRRFDREIHLKGILVTGFVLMGVTVACLAAALYVFDYFVAQEESRDPVPTPIVATTPPTAVPLPHLQERPRVDLQSFRQAEVETLEGWGWTDEAAGVAHIPIEQALDLVAESGLPSFPAAPEAPKPE